MGAGQSGGVEIGGSSLGYQVLRVYPNSPGSRAGLKAYFDFIVAIGNTRFNKEDGSLREILKASVDQKLKMIVFNTRNKMAREVEIVPTTSWGGSGLLGVSIKHSSFDKADERVWHVVEVDPGSPASQAGFKAGEDYVIGSDSILQENDDLYNLIEAHEAKALKLFVYNVKTDNCREVICHPNSKWGGRGYLGCEFGHGLLHRIPYADSQGGDSQPGSLPTSRVQQPSMPQQTNGSVPLRSQTTMQSPQQNPFSQMPMQPGHQLFQQALFDQRPNQQSQQQPQSKPADKPPVLPHPPQAPQTFAQLASAQYQAQQFQQSSQQQQQHQQPQMMNQSNTNSSPPPPPPQSTAQSSSQPAQQPLNDKQESSFNFSNLSQSYNINNQGPPNFEAHNAPQNYSSAHITIPNDQPPLGQSNQLNSAPPQMPQQLSSNQTGPQHGGPPMDSHRTEQPSVQQYNFGFQSNQQQSAPLAHQNESLPYNNPVMPSLAGPQFSSLQVLPPPPTMYPQSHSQQQQQQQQQQLPPPPIQPNQQQQPYNFGAAPQQSSPSENPYSQMYK